MAQSRTLTITLADNLAAAIEDAVESGAFPDADTVISDALSRSLSVGPPIVTTAEDMRRAWDEGIASGEADEPGPVIMDRLVRQYSQRS